MATLQMRREEQDGSVTLKLEGTFSGQAAEELEGWLSDLAGDGARDVVLDFSRVREFLDLSVVSIAEAIDRSSPFPANIRLRGIGPHQERVFRCFGIRTDKESPRDLPYYRPEDSLAP
jgi:anti-anti-sigma regulatory factor